MAKAGRFDSLLAPNDGGAITVVFLHGLLRTSAVMKKLARCSLHVCDAGKKGLQVITGSRLDQDDRSAVTRQAKL